MGLRFSENIYDIENYHKLQELALEMMALAKGLNAEDFKLAIGPLLNHRTPFVAGTAAVIDANGRILLIKRADNRKWALPGGALAFGETPAEGVIRWFDEESLPEDNGPGHFVPMKEAYRVLRRDIRLYIDA